MSDLKQLTDVINKRLFCHEVLEYMPAVMEHEMERIRINDQFRRNAAVVKMFMFDDLIIAGTSMLTARGIKMVHELASEIGLEVKIMYSQAIVVKYKE